MRLERQSKLYTVTKLKTSLPSNEDDETCADDEQALMDQIMTNDPNKPAPDKALVFQADQEFKRQQQVEI